MLPCFPGSRKAGRTSWRDDRHLPENGQAKGGLGYPVSACNPQGECKDFKQAKTLLDEAVKLNPDNAEAKKDRDRIKLELTYQSLAPAAPAAPNLFRKNQLIHRRLLRRINKQVLIRMFLSLILFLKRGGVKET